MAPDFENPQLVRRLDWFHDDSLVASYQQDVVTDVSRQWWVNGRRYELLKPFYMLKISPVLPIDSGVYKCRLETDPLFALAISTSTITVVVMVKPPAPSKPQISAYSDTSVTLSWSQTAGAAHKPIRKYSILIKPENTDAGGYRVVSTRANLTTATITQLKPHTLYTFSVSGENSVGASDFGPEVQFRTIGEAPKSPPVIESLKNSTPGCVDVAWQAPPTSNGKIDGYRIMVHRLSTGAMREWYLTGNRQALCSLAHYADFRLSIEADNGYGFSPSASTIFRTDQSVPEVPPEWIEARTLTADKILLRWYEPAIANGNIVAYQLYYKERKSKRPSTFIRLSVQPGETHKNFAYNASKLAPNMEYEFQISASTIKGESKRSPPIYATTDFAVPLAPRIMNISFDCEKSVSISWVSPSEPVDFFQILLESDSAFTFNTTEKQIEFEDLPLHQRFSVRISAVIRSLLDNETLLESPFSKSEVFMLAEKCTLQSSICSSFNRNCVPMTTFSMEPSRSASFAFFLIALFVMVVLALFVFWLFKQRCFMVKQYLKKSEKKSFKNMEQVSLVYEGSEATSGETITVGNFDKYYEELTANNNQLFKQQFEEIEADTSEIVEESDEVFEENRLKNRYLNIAPVESTRIRLHSSGNSDYINANYIDSCDEKNAYIATQAPLPHTFGDFWAMVWQEKCNVIVVITNLVERGRRKCDQYWPASSKTVLTFGNLHVGLDTERPNAYFVHRILTLKSSKCLLPERIIHQVHFTSWPDHGVPNTVFPLLSFMNYVSEIQSTGPIVVHCSAGVGRSGSYILIDSMRRHLLQCDRINVQAHLKHIRRQRAKLVQTLEQYIFCHDVMRQLIRHGISRQPVINFVNYVDFLFNQKVPDGRTRLQMQYEDVCKCPHKPSCEIPHGYVVLPGYHRTDEFIVGNWPNECSELWDAVWEHNCQTILLVGADVEMGDYFRAHEASTSSPTTVTGMTIERHEGNVLLRNNEDELCIRIIRVRPASLDLDIWGEIERIQEEMLQYHKCQTMLLDPANTSIPYILCALQSAACQMEQERNVDVLQCLASYRFLQCGCWSSQSNIEYIYEKVLELTNLQKS
uniref:protein-tyrosine-phosphatase n=2 Tax=Acrobeloides nanus TaxID=290746 RepID=A0A914EBH7_9BILA